MLFTPYQLCLLFFIYAFFGWCTEVCYAAVDTGQFTNRGFLNGPLCPVYGFGVLIVILFLEPLEENLPLLFLGSVLLTTVLEYVTGFLLEKLCHAKWWDYSDKPFNLHGYICLEFSLIWGFACLIVVRMLHPAVLRLVELLPHLAGVLLLVICFVLLAADLAATVNTVYQLNRQLKRITELAEGIHSASDKLGTGLYEGTIAVKNRSEEAKEKLEDAKLEAREKLEDAKSEAHEKLADARSEAKEKLSAAREELEERTQSLAERAPDPRRELEQMKVRLTAALNEKHWGQRRLLKAFPGLHHIQHQSALDELRRAWKKK